MRPSDAPGFPRPPGTDTPPAPGGNVSTSFYVTTPIYYVNGRPHIGHAYTSIAADVLARWHRMLGDDVFLLTGTDEHGQKVLEKAQERGMSPKAHADDMVQTSWKPVMDRLGVTYDRFLRTTDADHIETVQAALTWLKERELLYRATYEGWYSPSAERFWTEKDLIDGRCPDTGQPVQKVQESNWFFRMGNFQDALVDHIERHPTFIQPDNRRNEVLGFLRKPLEDLCISRPTSRMGWGIPLPFDGDYVTYVWFDALLNYVSATGWRPGEPVPARWPAQLQLVGKDILTTHAVYWSTMLMALELPLPDTLFAHGWWVAADGRKMSKSLGNTLDVDRLIEAWGLDPVRFFLLREIAFGADGAFSHEGFQTRYNADLANDLGNLLHRGLSMTGNWLGGTVPAFGPGTGFEEGVAATARAAVDGYVDAMARTDLQGAIESLWTLVRAGNKYVDDTKPWALNKAGDPALATVLRTTLEISHVAGALLLPVMPTKAAELLERLNAPDATSSVRAWRQGAAPLQALNTGAPLTVGDPLFPRHKDLPPAIAELLASIAAETPPAPPPEKKKPAAPKKPVTAGIADLITFEDFAKLALRVGRVVEARKHASADRLLVLQVDIGEAQPRQIVAGIAAHYAPESLVDRSIVVVANLAPTELRGEISQGMLLAANQDAIVRLVEVDAPPGTVVR
jgi:methionyl-tRNA synthetase